MGYLKDLLTISEIFLIFGLLYLIVDLIIPVVPDLKTSVSNIQNITNTVQNDIDIGTKVRDWFKKVF